MLGAAVAWWPAAAGAVPTPNDRTGKYACSLLTASEVRQAIGVAVVAKPHGAVPPVGGRAGNSQCVYEIKGGAPGDYALQIIVQTAKNAATAKQLSGFDVRPPTSNVVPVGDLAQLSSPSILEILKGTQVVELDLGNATGSLPVGGGGAVLTKLGQILVARLGGTAPKQKPCTLAQSAAVAQRSVSNGSLSEIAREYNGRYVTSWTDETFGTSGSWVSVLRIDTKTGLATYKLPAIRGGILGKGSTFGPAKLQIVVNDVRAAQRVSGSTAGFGAFLLTSNPGSLEINLTIQRIPHNPDVRCFEVTLDEDPAFGGRGTYTVTFKNGTEATGTIRWTH
jgi:hypothetical protein